MSMEKNNTIVNLNTRLSQVRGSEKSHNSWLRQVTVVEKFG